MILNDEQSSMFIKQKEERMSVKVNKTDFS